jgi:hypothetical protein
MVLATMAADLEPNIRIAASAPTAPTAALVCRCRRRRFHLRIHLAWHRCRSHLRYRPRPRRQDRTRKSSKSRPRRRHHHQPRPRHPHRHHHHLRHRPSRLLHHHRHPRPRHPRARQRSHPDRLSLVGRSRRAGTSLFAGGTLPLGTMRMTSGLTATRRRSNRPTARHRGEWAASPCPGPPGRSPHQESELRSCRRRAT